MKKKGDSIKALQFEVEGEAGLLRCDLYNDTRRQLVEAKSSAIRGAIRMAIGQLLDYRMHLRERNVTCAVLLPQRPSEDLEKLLSSVDFAVVWRSGKSGFSDNANGLFV